MSAVSSPAHRISGDFDHYDPNFTAEISNKMRVPHKLFATGEGRNSSGGQILTTSSNLLLDVREGMDKVSMRVPDRIVVAGHEHSETKAPPRELRLEQTTQAPRTDFFRVETPPRVLSLEDHIFPTVNDGDDDYSPDMEKELNANSGVVALTDDRKKIPDTPVELNSLDTSLSPTGDLLLIRRQILKLNRRVLLLEQENQIRQQKDVEEFLSVFY